MNEFYDYICKQLLDLLKKRRVVVFYDPRKEFNPFIDELPVLDNHDDAVTPVHVLDSLIHLACFDGSFFGLRAAVEPLVRTDQPELLLIYLPGVLRDRRGSVLMELEKGGDTYEPQLKRLARNVLRQKYTEGTIDQMLAPESITYKDIVAFLQQTGGEESYSMLKLIFTGVADGVSLLVKWLVDESKDGAIEKKEAVAELYALIESRFGLTVPLETIISDARKRTIRCILINEFRADLDCEPPPSVSMIPVYPTKSHLERIQKATEKLRADHPEVYPELADQVEAELGLREASLDPSCLGRVDTFRFEEQLLLKYCGGLIARSDYKSALQVITERSSCFWVDRDISRQTQWEACRLMAELGLQIEPVKPYLEKKGTDSAGWIKAYTAEEGWWQADLIHRNLESWIAKMDGEPEAETALAVTRREYEELLKKMAEGFSNALRTTGWTAPGILQQTQVYSELVQSGRGRVALFCVDAMRYEMGAELIRLLKNAQELTLSPCLAALPTITPVGMAALLPGASASFSITEHKGKLAAKIDEAIMPGLNERLKYFKAKVPNLVEMTLGKLLQSSSSKLARTIANASLVVVRSQEIDALGESGDDWIARQLMDTIVGNLARAVHKLAACGIDRFVIVSDHGYQFSMRKEEDMRMDSPAGETIEIHRRCWAGRGGATPSGAVRVTGAELGYDTDLDVIFPTGLAVFKTQGGLSFHHGGISLQEMVIPVITLRMAIASQEKSAAAQVKILGHPKAITNRTLGIEIACDPHIFQKDAVTLRVILVSKGEQVGETGMAVGGVFDRKTGSVTIRPGAKVSVGIMLTKDDCESVRIMVQDPATDAVLARSEELPVKLGI